VPTRVYDAYLDRLSPGSRTSVAGHLRRAAAVLGADPEALHWHELSPAQLQKVRDVLLERGAGPMSVNNVVSAVRGAAATGLSNEVLGHGWWESDEGKRRHVRLEALRRVSLAPVERTGPNSRALSPREFEALLGACLSERSVAGARDAAIVVAAYVGGISAPELASLDPDDLLSRPPRMVFGRHSRSREREVPLGRRAAGLLAEWTAVRGNRPGKLYVRLDRWGNPTGKDMSALGAHWVLKSRSEKAGLPEPASAPDLRHTAIRDLLSAGVGDLTVLAIIGQSVDLSPYGDQPEGTRRERRGEGATPYHKWDDDLFSSERARLLRALL
jgi:integrase